MSVMASQVTSLTIIYSTVYSATDKENHKSSVSLAFVRGIHRWPVNSPHKGPVTRKMFPFDDVIMQASVLIPGPDCGWHGAHVQWARLCPQLPVRQWHRPRGCRCQELPVSVGYHWHENAGILMKFPSLASPEVVIWQLPVQPWRHFRFNDDCVSQYIIGCWVYDLYIYMYHIFDLGHVCVCVRACVRARMCWRKEIITIRSQYVTVILRYPKARPQDTPRPNGRRMGWRSWVQSLTKVFPLCILKELIPRFRSWLWHHRLPNVTTTEAQPRLWWHLGVCGVTAMTENEVSISILSWYHKINFKLGVVDKPNCLSAAKV